MNHIIPRASIVSAKRLPIGKVNGIFAHQTPEVLFQSLISQQLADLPGYSKEQIDQVILGNVTNQGGNLARRCALAAGFPVETPAFTVDSQCASGLVAVASGVQTIISGQSALVLAGGIESTSLANMTINRDTNAVLRRFPMVPAGQLDLDMGIVAENMTQKYHVSREQQDAYALKSHQKAKQAFEMGLLNRECYAFKAENIKYMQDQCPRFDTNLEKLAQLKSVFSKQGSVTAGNSCPINDGAGTVLLKKFDPNDIVQGYYLDHELVGLAPDQFLLGPISATRKLLVKHRLSITDIDVIEMNEAFAVQGIICQKALDIQDDQLNPLGGALSYGHPYGATGAILIARLLNSLNQIPKPALGIVTLCVAGGMGMSMLIGNQHWT
ncbi:thiolase family protein [Leuconostoc gelidum]|uniref:acetyl-CoA C-acyltransferase n=1 Tax=Leuconostoc gelidum subsp. gelidum TaxID=1607839 RepID=A0ABS7V250_LEUGE|nr:thiolase family protein [Leuconostoc gelidum]MBZ5964894.1 thiolase family protein [Leuconostoc gelidum subsp. gelidum]MBZ5999052.1 thiolase family protein [Leuconostoc gelidum subsp. gelidum]